MRKLRDQGELQLDGLLSVFARRVFVLEAACFSSRIIVDLPQGRRGCRGAVSVDVGLQRV